MTTTPTPCTLSPSAFLDTLTGFDELAIKRAFSAPIGDLDKVALLRGLAFVHIRRETGAKDSDAYRQAMELPQGVLGDLFADEDDIEADEGKAQPEQTPAP